MCQDFLSRARSKMEFHAYNAFLDAMVELRAMYRLHKGAQAVEVGFKSYMPMCLDCLETRTSEIYA